MKRVAIAAAAVIGLLIVWQLFSASPRDDGSYLGYVEGDLLYIGPVEGERLGGLSSTPARRSTLARRCS